MLKTRYIRCKLLLEEAKDIQLWKESVIKSKSVYHTMNMFRRHDTRINSLVAECWIPDDDVPKITGVFQSKYVCWFQYNHHYSMMMTSIFCHHYRSIMIMMTKCWSMEVWKNKFSTNLKLIYLSSHPIISLVFGYILVYSRPHSNFNIISVNKNNASLTCWEQLLLH